MILDSQKMFAVIKQLYKQKMANPRKQEPLSVDSLALYFQCSCDDILKSVGPLVMEGTIYIKSGEASKSPAGKGHIARHIMLNDNLLVA